MDKRIKDLWWQWAVPAMIIFPIMVGMTWLFAEGLDKETKMQDQIVTEWVK